MKQRRMRMDAIRSLCFAFFYSVTFYSLLWFDQNKFQVAETG